MSKRSRPVDKAKPAAKKKVKQVNGRRPGPQPSRTAINPAEPWPFPAPKGKS